MTATRRTDSLASPMFTFGLLLGTVVWMLHMVG